MLTRTSENVGTVYERLRWFMHSHGIYMERLPLQEEWEMDHDGSMEFANKFSIESGAKPQQFSLAITWIGLLVILFAFTRLLKLLKAIGSYWLFQSLGFWMFLRLHTMKVRWNLEGYVDAVFKVAGAKRCEDTLKTLS